MFAHSPAPSLPLALTEGLAVGGLSETLAGASAAIAPVGVVASPLALLTAFWAHKRITRKQTDDFALGAVERLQLVIDSQGKQINALTNAMADERRVCEANIARLEAEGRQREDRFAGIARHAKNNLDAIMLAVKFAPDKAAAIVAEIEARQEREREFAEG